MMGRKMPKKKEQRIRRSWRTTRWQTVPCSVLDCWCCVIKADTGTLVVDEGVLGRRLAKFLVKEHNELLEMKLEMKGD